MRPLLERLLRPFGPRGPGAQQAAAVDSGRQDEGPTQGTTFRAGAGAVRLEDLAVESKGSVETERLPTVGIVIPNHNGRHHFERCFASLSSLDYPKDKLDVILVDNGSVDGSVEELRDKHSWVRLVANQRNAGFTGGCNQGAQLAKKAEVLVFLNNDVRVEARWLRELVSPIVRGECDATTAKLYSWDGKLINAAGGGMNFHGIGIQQGYGEPPGPEHDVPRLSLFAHGAAMAIGSRLFQELGGFDPEFFAYYEDVDLGWRMWVLGYTIHYVPSAVCYHHHSSTSQTFPPETIRLLQVRNPIYSCFKNYSDENLRRVLPAIIALSIRRTLLISGIPSDRPFRIEHAAAERPNAIGKLLSKAREAFNPEISIRRVAAADLIAINDFLGNWGHWMERRAEVQSRRKRSDEEIFRLFLKPMWCVEEEPAYRQLQEGMAAFMGIDEMFGGLSIPGADPKK